MAIYVNGTVLAYMEFALCNALEQAIVMPRMQEQPVALHQERQRLASDKRDRYVFWPFAITFGAIGPLTRAYAFLV